jgi:predicted amidohydrolase YtcJ
MYLARTNAVEIAQEYGEEYLEWLVPMRSIIEGGVMAVYESDSHQIAGTGHFYFLSQMVNRINIEGNVIAPRQRINRIWALKTATTWAPYYLHKEQEIGTLEEGKFADLQVLNKNYFDEATVPDLMLKTVRPLMTMVGGNVMYLDTHLAAELGREPLGIQPEQVIRQIAEWEAEVPR